MNTQLKKNINIAGTVGYIISILMIVALICGMVAVALCTAAAARVSGEHVDVTVATDIAIEADSNIFEKLKNFVTLDKGKNFIDVLEEGGKEVQVDDSMLSAISMKETENGVAIEAKTNPVIFTAKRLIAALVVAFVYLGALTIMFYMIKALMKALKGCDTPFSAEVIKKMERFGWSLIPVIVLSAVNEGVMGALTSGGSLFNFSLNIGGLLVLAIVFVLILVFKYGAELQKESDETL